MKVIADVQVVKGQLMQRQNEVGESRADCVVQRVRWAAFPIEGNAECVLRAEAPEDTYGANGHLRRNAAAD